MTRPNSTQTISTQNPRQTSTQTGPFSTTQSAKEKDCQCESPIQPFQSNFARQLHENEVMRRNPQNRIQREIAVRQPIQQTITPKQTISHVPQQQQNALSPTRQTQTNMEIDYQSPALQQQLEYKPHEALQHTQNPALEYSTQNPALEYSTQARTQNPALEYSTQALQPLQHQPHLTLQQPHLALQHQPHLTLHQPHLTLQQPHLVLQQQQPHLILQQQQPHLASQQQQHKTHALQYTTQQQTTSQLALQDLQQETPALQYTTTTTTTTSNCIYKSTIFTRYIQTPHTKT